MSSNLLKCTLQLVAFSVVAYGLNLIFIDKYDIVGSAMFSAYLFFLALNWIIIFTFDYVAGNFIDKAGFVFIGFLFIKAIAIFAFLAILRQNVPLDKPLMLNFALTYLAYLFFSIFLCLRTLKFYQK